MEFKVLDIKCVFYILIGMDNKLWISDDSGILVWIDIYGNWF